jgi:dTMP kinase
VAIEGIDGAGKTTQVELLAQRLRQAGIDVLRAKEPTDGPHGRRLRASAVSGRLPPQEELDTFLADRREHVDTIIQPALAAGRTVILDRYYFSTAAYQGARGMDPEAILALNEAFAPQPDLLVLLKLSPATALARIAARGDGSGNLFERRETLQRCAEIFDTIRRPYLLVVDGALAPDRIHAAIARQLDLISAR